MNSTADTQAPQLTDREELITTISDQYKDLHGSRPRFLRTDKMTLDELRELSADLNERVEREIQDEIDEERGYSEEGIQKALEMGAPSREAAIRWFT